MKLNIKINKNVKKVLLGIFIAMAAYILLTPILLHFSGSTQIYKTPEGKNLPEVAIVLGAGVTPEGKPRDILKDRLDVAADLYYGEYITKIIVSGDNREENYNEPAAMFEYLTVGWEIPADDIVRDFAGRRTYDTCARAKEVFELDEVLMISQGYHLPRAILLCKSLGVDATGYSATLSNTYEGIWYYKFREFWAIHKAMWDIYVVEPEFVGGESIDIWDPELNQKAYE